MQEIVPIERIESKIYMIRGQKVMLDRNLSELYGVPTKVLNQAVKRNRERFPEDFMFALSKQEITNLINFEMATSRSQIMTSKNKGSNLRSQFVTSYHGGRRYLPFAFTEQGVSMLSSVLSSPRAIEINLLIIRAFVRLRKVLTDNKDLTYLFKELKHKVDKHDVEIGLIIRAIEKMIVVEKKPRNKMGFVK